MEMMPEIIYLIIPKEQAQTILNALCTNYTHFGRLFFESVALARNWIRANHEDCVDILDIIPCTLTFQEKDKN